MIYRLLLALALVASARGFEASEVDVETPSASFNKKELEEILRKDHSDRISNIFDSVNQIQCAGPANPPRSQTQLHSPHQGVLGRRYTWNIETQELCPGVDGKCSKEEL